MPDEKLRELVIFQSTVIACLELDEHGVLDRLVRPRRLPPCRLAGCCGWVRVGGGLDRVGGWGARGSAADDVNRCGGAATAIADNPHPNVISCL